LQNQVNHLKGFEVNVILWVVAAVLAALPARDHNDHNDAKDE
jgi:hypothetical protein